MIATATLGSHEGRCPWPCPCWRKCTCITQAPASNARRASRAISSGVTGTGCCRGSVSTPVSAQVMMALWGIQGSEIRTQRSEVKGQRSEVRGQRSEVRGQRSEVRGQDIRCPLSTVNSRIQPARDFPVLTSDYRLLIPDWSARDFPVLTSDY